MKIKLKLFAILFILPILSTCSSYKIAYDFTPPKTKQGLACIHNAQAQLNQCNNRCYYQYQSCLTTSKNQARQALPQLLREYPSQLEAWLNAREQYRRDLSWYEFRLDLMESRQATYLDRCEKKGTKRSKCRHHHSYPSLHLDRPTFHLARPKKPTLETEIVRIRKTNCSQDCGCQSNFRLAYASCGGVVKSKKVCIRNCN